MFSSIFYVSHQPSINIIPPVFPMQDKVIHAVEYFLLFISLLLNKDLCKGFHPLPILFSVGVFWAFLDEIHQSYVPGRDCSTGDFLADITGLALCLVVYILYSNRKKTVSKSIKQNKHSS